MSVFGWSTNACCLLQSQFNPGNDIGLPFSFSVRQNGFSLRGCTLRISVDTRYLFFQSALSSLTCPHRLLYPVCFLQCESVRVRTYNAKLEWSSKGRIHHIMPIAADSGRGLGVFNPPPLQCVAVRKRGSYWSPLPLLSSPDFSALNGVLHYTWCSWSSPVQGLNCKHQGWLRTVHYTSSCRLLSTGSFCRVCHFCSGFTNDMTCKG